MRLGGQLQRRRGLPDSSGNQQAFVVNETNGTWRTAEEVPGTAALNHGGNAATTSVSCASAGNCSAGGYYTDSSGHLQAFVVNETNGDLAHRGGGSRHRRAQRGRRRPDLLGVVCLG